MTPKISLIFAVAGVALLIGVPTALGDNWFADQQQAGARVSPDLVDRAVAAQQHRLFAMLDARERSLGVRHEAEPQAGAPGGGVAQAVSVRAPVGDDWFRVDRPNVPAPISGTSSASALEWPQLGVGFGIGVILMLGLYLALRAARTRQVAH